MRGIINIARRKLYLVALWEGGEEIYIVFNGRVQFLFLLRRLTFLLFQFGIGVTMLRSSGPLPAFCRCAHEPRWSWGGICQNQME